MFLIKDLTLPNQLRLNFEHQSGDLIIRGKNGLGKSLFLKSLAQLTDSKFESFFYEGIPIQEWDLQKYRSSVLYVSQVMPSQSMTVEDYLSLPFRFKAHDQKIKESANEITNRWRISGLDVTQLSLGQRQMLSLLRASHLSPKVLLLDEPTSNLDRDRTLEAEELIRKWKESSKGYFIMVSHDDRAAGRLQAKEVLLSDLLSSKMPEGLST